MKSIVAKTIVAAAALGTLAGCGGNPSHENCTNIPGAVIGGVAGGALGSQVGSGHGRDAAIGVGAAGGAVAGSRYGC